VQFPLKPSVIKQYDEKAWKKVFCILYFNCIRTNQGAFVQSRERNEKVYITGFDRFPNAMCLSKCKYTEAKGALFHKINVSYL